VRDEDDMHVTQNPELNIGVLNSGSFVATLRVLLTKVGHGKCYKCCLGNVLVALSSNKALGVIGNMWLQMLADG